MGKSLATNLHFRRFCAHARYDYNFTGLTSPPTLHVAVICAEFQHDIWWGEGDSNTLLKA